MAGHMNEAALALMAASVALSPSALVQVLESFRYAMDEITRAGQQYEQRWKPVLAEAWDTFQPWILIIARVQEETEAEHNRLIASGG